MENGNGNGNGNENNGGNGTGKKGDGKSIFERLINMSGPDGGAPYEEPKRPKGASEPGADAKAHLDNLIGGDAMFGGGSLRALLALTLGVDIENGLAGMETKPSETEPTGKRLELGLNGKNNPSKGEPVGKLENAFPEVLAYMETIPPARWPSLLAVIAEWLLTVGFARRMMKNVGIGSLAGVQDFVYATFEYEDDGEASRAVRKMLGLYDGEEAMKEELRGAADGDMGDPARRVAMLQSTIKTMFQTGNFLANSVADRGFDETVDMLGRGIDPYMNSDMGKESMERARKAQERYKDALNRKRKG